MNRVLWIAAWLFLAGSVKADDCTLKRVAQFDMELRGGTPVIEVMLNGRPAKMVVDTGAVWSALSSRAAEGLNSKRVEHKTITGMGGGEITHVAVVPELALDAVTLPDFQFLILDEKWSQDTDITGLIGTNILQKFDVEIDYHGQKVIFYSQDHCPGHVISWPHDNFARLPFDWSYNGPIVVPVKLDGHSLKAKLDTGASESFIEDKLVSDLFALTGDTPGVEPAGTVVGPDGKQLTLYQHRFEILELDELKFPHPKITFYAGKSHENDCIGVHCRRGGGADMLLGARHLRALHLYIAYREHAVYATTAN